MAIRKIKNSSMKPKYLNNECFICNYNEYHFTNLMNYEIIDNQN